LALDREDALKRGEKLLRQGKLDLAILEYARVVEDQPRDWNTRNTLGDLMARAGQVDKAVAQYAQIADHLMEEGFFPRAAAIYKKILKFKPDDESVQLRLGEISAKQSLLADARAYFTAVASRRRARGDQAGADQIVIRLGSLDPADFEARALAARTLAQSGDPIAAAAQFRAIRADLVEKGRHAEAQAALHEAIKLHAGDATERAELARVALAAGNTEVARGYLDRTGAGDDPNLLLLLTEIELRSGDLQAARAVLGAMAADVQALRPRILDLAARVASATADGAFLCVEMLVDTELESGNFADAAGVLREFAGRVPGHVPALLKLVEVSVDGGLDAEMYDAQAQLADAYLDRGQPAEARVIAEDLLSRDPADQAHVDRLRRALVLLDVPDPDIVIAERISSQSNFNALDVFAPFDLSDAPDPLLAEPSTAAALPASSDWASAGHDESEAEEDEPPARMPHSPPGPKIGHDIDLTQALAELEDMTDQTRPVRPNPQDLETVFDDFRSHVSKHAGVNEAAEQLALATTYLEMGMTDDAIVALTAAAHAPSHRFEAGSKLARLYLKRNNLEQAVEWLERAAEAPAPGVNEARELLYELGATLEQAGETSRALAVFLELQADASDYRDVAARVDRLARVQAGG
jgi:tetratricopeptide (TPR) repeat protein